ncbi:hypothetical protein HDV05_008775 [Chytridiales sp. JEL 0842]|nr:hypothetical protein HDV05_008775 [Chytridiales sp. JEL 0842]
MYSEPPQGQVIDPLQPPTPSQVEDAIRQMYTPTTPSDVQKQIQGWLQNVQSLPGAWDIAHYLLQSDSPEVQFFGALTLQVKISRDWNTLSPEHIPNLRIELINNLIRLSAGPSFVLTKLCTALSSYAFKTVPDLWPKPISSFVESMQTQISQSPDSRARVAVESSMLEFLKVVAEELQRAVFASESKKAKFHAELQQDRVVALDVVLSVLRADLPEDPILNAVMCGLKCKALTCAQSWAQLECGIPIEYMGTILTLALQHLAVPSTFETSCQVLTEFFSLSELAKYQQTICANILPSLISGVVRDQFAKSLQEQDPETARPLCQLLSKFAESFPKYLIANLDSQPTLLFLEMLLGFSNFPGYFAADEDVSDIPGQAWYELEEVLMDPDVVPRLSYLSYAAEIRTDPVTLKPILIRKSEMDSVRIVGGQQAADGNEYAPTLDPVKLERGERIFKVGMEIFQKLVEILRGKSQRPSDFVWNQWSSDERDRFTTRRRDISDSLVSCYMILGVPMLEGLITLAVAQTQQASEGKTGVAEALESTLFCIRSIAEELNLSDSTHPPVLFGEHILAKIAQLPDQHFHRPKSTMCLLIGAERYPQWLKRNPGWVLPVVSFLIGCVGVSRVSASATTGLEAVCGSCRGHLGEVAGDMVAAWGGRSGKLNMADKTRFIRAVSQVLQPLTPRAQLPHVVGLISPLANYLNAALTALAAAPMLPTGQINPDLVERQAIIDILKLMKGVCEGIRSPDELELDDDDEDAKPGRGEKVESMEDLDGELRDTIESAKAVVWGTLKGVMNVCRFDEDITESVCAFLNSTMIGRGLAIFNFQPVELASSLVPSFSALPLACQLKSLIILIQTIPEPNSLEAVGMNGETQVRVVLRQLVMEVNGVAFRVLGSKEGMEDRPDIVDGYFKLLSTTLYKHPWSLLTLPEDQLATIFLTLVLTGLQLHERASSLAVIDFMRDWVSYDPAGLESVWTGTSKGMDEKEEEARQRRWAERKRFREVVVGVFGKIGFQVIQNLLAGIGGGLPTSMLPTLSDLFHRIIHYFPDDARAWTTQALEVEGFPSRHCTREDKEAFVKGMMIANMKAFKEHVKRFTLKCRNLQDTAYGASLRV